jgi:YbbR domain-containing protein
MNRFLAGLLKNLRYKVSSVVLACLLWYIVQGEQIIEVSRTINVQIEVPEGFMIKGESNRVKYATIRGPRVLMGDIATRPLEAQVAITKKKPGVHRLRISKDNLPRWDDRIRITIEDPDLPLIMDEKLTRNVPIKEVTQGVPAEGYIIEKINLKPLRVDITGLKTDVAKVKEVYTEPVDVAGIQQTKSFEVRLVPPPGVEPNGISPDIAQLSVLIGEKKVNKRFGSIPVEVVGTEFQSGVNPRYVSILIQGTPAVLDFVERSDLRAFVEASELKPGRHQKEIQVKIPADTTLIETFPENAEVDIGTDKKLN